MPNNERCQGIEKFYKEAARNFLKWSPDPKRIGLYAMHIGYQNWQEPVNNSISAIQMSRKIIELSEIKPGQIILDAGCGVGSLTFEITNIEPKSRVYGIDISGNHIHLASQYTDQDESSSPIFTIQDYEHIAFQGGTFDRIFFCESLIHSRNKEDLIQESNRVLKPEGTITIADIFMHTDALTKEEADIIERLKTHMYIPNIIHIQELMTFLSTNGFTLINSRNITEDVIAPTDYYPLDKQKLDEENPPQDLERLLTGLQNLLREGKAGYYIVIAQKS